MVEEAPGEAVAPKWRTAGDSVVGATHRRSGIPNQDALLLSAAAPPLPVIAAVSDGHGSPKCFRSHVGSRIAVGVAALVLREYLDVAGDADPSTWIPAEIARRWSEAVRLDLMLSPLTAEELDVVEQKSGPAARRLVESGPLLAYGATVLAAAVGEKSLVYLQLGDGEILTVSDAGEVRRALPGDARLFADETTSLASPSAVRDFRLQVVSGEEGIPALVLLTTDGYVNSFRDDEGFLRVGADILQLIASVGLDTVAADMTAWLDEATRLGSGDDVTLAVICREDAVRRPDAVATGVPGAAPSATATQADGEPDE